MKIRSLWVGMILIASLAPALLAGELAKMTKGKLVTLQDGKAVAAPESALEGKELIAIYYSAHWCPPCRTFTPTLSKFYDDAKAKYPKFEMIFVSSDKSADQMAEYMVWGKMNFLALNYKSRAISAIRSLSASGIPYLIVLDADGKQILGKSEGEEYVAPSKILGQLKTLLEEKGT